MFPGQLLDSGQAYSMEAPNEQANLRSQALMLFSDRLVKGKWNKVIRSLTRKPKKLLDLQSSKSPTCTVNRHYIGVQSVSIERIQGSEGRMEDFDYSFNPIQERLRSRWLNIASLRLAGVDLPPVELIQFEEIFFVRDGHHRISVASALGEEFIDAEITQETC